jgi:diguanylate cyclase (GGDEF)-like protein
MPESSQANGAGQRSNSGWGQTRFGVLVPLGIVVAVAIVCIVVAALMSAHRADVVALERERQLLAKAITTDGEWSLGRLQAVITSSASVSAGDIEQSPAQVQQRLGVWLGPLSDHNLVLVLNSRNEIAYSQHGNDAPDLTLHTAVFMQLQSIAEYARGRLYAMPPGVMRLVGTRDGSVLLHNFDGRLALSTAIPVQNSGGEASDPATGPIVLTLRLVGPRTLTGIGERLQLTNLLMVPGNQALPGYNSLDFLDHRAQPIAHFTWLPRKPGAEILQSVVPFIGIALAGFALLSWLVVRYMRATAATIAAGEDRLRYLALHDALCGLPNRNAFSERLEAVIVEVKAGGTAAAVFYIDLDHFKDVNDTLGHPIGDELIRVVTKRQSRMMKGEDMVARLGGDEFAVIAVGSSDHAVLDRIATRMISTLCTPYSIGGHTIVIGASIGIAAIDGSTGAADILRYADMALYRAKNEGRNRACIFDEVMDANLSQRKLIEQDLREAIGNGGLKVAYQPMFNAGGDKVLGVEALARWAHPVRGPMRPDEFIPIAEHSGLIIPLGECVLRQACIDAQAWPGISVSVNVSPLQFRRLDFVSTVERTLSETGFDPARLELELTESTLLGNLDNAEDAMRRLKALGVKLALDDFGTGYSSLLYLRRFPFDKLKIDKSFVLSIEKTADAAAIVHAVVSLGRGLGMKVTAEGVETAEQHLFLRAAGVHCMQGFRFGKPMPAGEIAARLATPGVYRSIEGDARAALAG